MNIKTKCKNLISVLLVSATMLSFVPLAKMAGVDLSSLFIQASATNYEVFEYEVDTYIPAVRITSCDKNASGKIIIPEEIEGYPVIWIGDRAFMDCVNITSVKTPVNLESVGISAFEGCSSLESVTISENISDIGVCAFAYCDSLLSITVDENNLYYSSDDRGVLFNKDKTRLINYPMGNAENSYIIERGVEDISIYAFSTNNPPHLHHLHIPLSVTIISDIEVPSDNDGDFDLNEGNPNNHIYYEGSLEEFKQIKNYHWFDAVIHLNSYGQEIDTPEIPEEPKEIESVDGTESPVKVYPEDGAYDGEVFVDVKEVELKNDEVSELEAEYARLSINTSAKAIITYDIKVVRKDDNGETSYADINNGKKVRVKIPAPEDYDASKKYVILHKLSTVQNENNKLINYIGKTTTEEINGKIYFVIDVEHFSNFTIMEVEKKRVSSISITSLPSKTTCTYKSDSLDLSGIALTVTYSDGTTETITDTSKMTASGFDGKKVGTQTVTVEYEGATAEFEITVSYAWWQWIIRILLLGFLWY